ncbi:MAG: hypothetical protein B5M56_11205, partial [Desulfococcus sp. 4484_241]
LSGGGSDAEHRNQNNPLTSSFTRSAWERQALDRRAALYLHSKAVAKATRRRALSGNGSDAEHRNQNK